MPQRPPRVFATPPKRLPRWVMHIVIALAVLAVVTAIYLMGRQMIRGQKKNAAWNTGAQPAVVLAVAPSAPPALRRHTDRS